ncbi:hypothetical protein OY671_013036, partial [Metschnikowia pulcherrima]
APGPARTRRDRARHRPDRIRRIDPFVHPRHDAGPPPPDSAELGTHAGDAGHSYRAAGAAAAGVHDRLCGGDAAQLSLSPPAGRAAQGPCRKRAADRGADPGRRVVHRDHGRHRHDRRHGQGRDDRGAAGDGSAARRRHGVPGHP